MVLDDKYKLSTYLKRFDWMHPKSKWSFSKLGSYNGCNRRFKYIYIDKVKLDREFEHSVPFIKGRFIHSRIEKLIASKVGLTSEKLYNPMVHNDDKINITIEDIIDWNKILDKFYNHEFYKGLITELVHSTFIGIEHKLDYKNLFLGFIDLVSVANGTLYIIDWKTGRSKDQSFNQLCSYAYIIIEELLDRGLEIDRVLLKYSFIEDPDYDRTIDLPINEFLDSHLESISRYSTTMDNLSVEDATKGKFIADEDGWKRTSNSSECTYCPVKSYCKKDLPSVDDLISSILK